MKCITVFYNVSISDNVISTICKAGVKEYSIIPRTHGCGGVTGPRFDDHVWPGYNSIMIIIAPGDVATAVMDALQKLRNTAKVRRTGLYAFQTAVEATLTPPPDN
jgi:hypothetical protein